MVGIDGQGRTAVQPRWQGAIAAPAVEFGPTPLPLLSGTLPPTLRGTLYRNGPARFERGGLRVGHWFDGDGAILAVTFGPTGATATYRYVQSLGYQEEEAAGALLYHGYGTVLPRPLWQRWQTQLKNAANTSVLALPDGLLALWEGGWPHRLDRETLATLGSDGLDGLGPNDPYSAHPKRHPVTGDIFNFGLAPGPNATLNLYRSGPDGTITQRNAIPLNGIPLIHDFTLAGRYLVFCIAPVRLNALPAVLGLRSFSDSLMWQPRQGMQILVIAADTLEVVATEEAEPWFQWHFGRSGEDDQGRIWLDLVRYPDWTTNKTLQQVPQGEILTPSQGELWRIWINPQGATLLDAYPLVAQACEFPVPAPGGLDTYLAVHRPGVTPADGDLFGAIARYHADSQALTIAAAPPGCYPSEPIPAPDSHQGSGEGWVLTVVYDGNDHHSELWIYQSDRLDAGPIARLGLPEVIPHSFHGTWQGA